MLSEETGSQRPCLIIKNYAGDHVVAEVEFQNSKGEVVGYWAHGSFDPSLPYQGD